MNLIVKRDARFREYYRMFTQPRDKSPKSVSEKEVNYGLLMAVTTTTTGKCVGLAFACDLPAPPCMHA